MALTFGTLLSSQGADAHRHGPFGAIRGNPSYITWSVAHGQTSTRTAQTPTWSGRLARSLGASCLGKIRPAPPGPHLSVWPAVLLRVANKENISEPFA
jgi:hypothetical protein